MSYNNTNNDTTTHLINKQPTHTNAILNTIPLRMQLILT